MSTKALLSDGIGRKWHFDRNQHGIFSSDSIENKVMATMKDAFYSAIGYNKQTK